MTSTQSHSRPFDIVFIGQDECASYGWNGIAWCLSDEEHGNQTTFKVHLDDGEIGFIRVNNTRLAHRDSAGFKIGDVMVPYAITECGFYSK